MMTGIKVKEEKKIEKEFENNEKIEKEFENKDESK